MVAGWASSVIRAPTIAVASLLLVGANTTENTKAHREPSALSVNALPVPSALTAKKIEQEQPCQKGVENRASELCAQWKAADAGKDAADWTQRSFWVGVFGTLGLLASLFYTRRAVKVASDATNDARRALEIAEQTADRQLRPYVHVERIEPLDFSTEILAVNIKIKNFGQTPAQNFKSRFNYGWCEPGKIISHKPDLTTHDLKADIPPGHSQRMIFAIEPPENHEGHWDWKKFEPAVANGSTILVVCVSFEFTCFGTLERRDTIVVFDRGKPRYLLPADDFVFN